MQFNQRERILPLNDFTKFYKIELDPNEQNFILSFPVGYLNRDGVHLVMKG